MGEINWPEVFNNFPPLKGIPMKASTQNVITKATARKAILVKTLELLGASDIDIYFRAKGCNGCSVVFKGKHVLTLEDVLSADPWSIHGHEVILELRANHALAGKPGERLAISSAFPWEVVQDHLGNAYIWRELRSFFLQAIEDKAAESATVKAADLL